MLPDNDTKAIFDDDCEDDETVESHIVDESEANNPKIVDPISAIEEQQKVQDSIRAKRKEAARAERDRKLQEQKDLETKEAKKRKLRKWFAPFLFIWEQILSLENFERLLFVVFVDSMMLFILMAILYIIFIAVTSGGSDNLGILIFKLVSMIVVAAICLIAQMNIKPVESKSKDAEE